MNKMFVAYYYFNGLDNLNLGFHVSLSQPNIEIHIPFGFFRIGWVNKIPMNQEKVRKKRLYKWLYRAYGIKEPLN